MIKINFEDYEIHYSDEGGALILCQDMILNNVATLPEALMVLLGEVTTNDPEDYDEHIFTLYSINSHKEDK